MMTSQFIIEKFEPVFQKYHYISFSYIVPPQVFSIKDCSEKKNSERYKTDDTSVLFQIIILVPGQSGAGEERAAGWTVRNINKGKTCARLSYFLFYYLLNVRHTVVASVFDIYF